MHSDPVFWLLATMLAVAVYTDVRRHRIPNELSLIGLCVGLILQVMTGGLPGFVSGFLGCLAGFACFIPLYALRGMGAGDVKLLAAVGSFLGPLGAAYAAMASLVAGGVAAIGYVAWRAVRAGVNSWAHEGSSAVWASTFVAVRLARRDRLPFALPIAAGSLAAAAYSNHSADFAQWLQGAF
jgi:prepilin peptidase CpaA